MFKCFFNSSSKTGKRILRSEYLINKNNFENFSNGNKQRPENKRVKLSELFTDDKKDQSKIKTLKKNDFFLKKYNNKINKKSDSNKEFSDDSPTTSKGEYYEKETSTSKKPVILKAFKNTFYSESQNESKFSNNNKFKYYDYQKEINIEESLDMIINNASVDKIENQSERTSKVDEIKHKINKENTKSLRILKKSDYYSTEYSLVNKNLTNESLNSSESQIENLNKKDSIEDLENEEILRYMCLPLNMQKMEDIKFKWQQFFISSQRVIPDINRSINNKPDSIYYEYIKDLIDEFTDKQLLFALKNILLNEDVMKGYEMLFIFRDLFFRLKSHGTFDLSSKLNIIMLYEIFFLFELIEHKIKNEDHSINTISRLIMQMISMTIDYQRFFFSENKIEENLMMLKAMLDKNVIDVYLIQKFLKQYSEIDIINTLKDCVYKIKYFKTEYNLNLSIFYILDNYVKICKINKEWESINDQKFKFLVKRLITEFLTMMQDDKLQLMDLTFNNFQFENLIYIFPPEQKDIFLQSINNAIISKIYKELKLISEDKILITDGRTITQSINHLKRIKKNTYKENLFKETYLLLSDFIHENYTFSLLSTLKEEKKLDDFHNAGLLMIYDTWIDGLIEAAIENDICDYNILEPFMALLLIRIQNYKIESINTYMLKKLYYLGKYNFNDILQSEKFNSNTLRNYFKILDELTNFLPKYLDQIKNNFKTAISSNKFNSNYSTLTLDKETYEILNKFYTKFFEKEAIKLENSNYGLHYEEDFELSNSINPYLMRFKIIPKEMYMVSFLPNFCKNLTQELKTDFNKEILITHSKLVFGIIGAAIKYNVFTLKLANSFINFIITIYSDKTEIFFKHLLEDIDLFRDFNFILNHIFNPEDNLLVKDYENIKYKKNKKNNKKSEQIEAEDSEVNLDFIQNLYMTNETVMNKLNDKYDINKYNLKNKEDFDIHSHKINTLMFKDAITEFIEEDEEMQLFLDKYLEDQSAVTNTHQNFSNSHTTFMNSFRLQHESPLDNSEEINFIKDETKYNKKSDLENSDKFALNSYMNRKMASKPQDLYYEINQIKTFANVKAVIFNNEEISVSQVENLLNDEILFCKILLDMKKISLVINEILKRTPLSILNEYFQNFHNSEFLLKGSCNKLNEEIILINSEIANSILNLSCYSVADIVKSNLFYEFLNDFIVANNKSIYRKSTPIPDINKNNLVLHNYPIFPMIIPFIVENIEPNSNGKKIDIYQKANFYKCSTNAIRTQKSFENFLFLKSILRYQDKNINIYEYNNLI